MWHMHAGAHLSVQWISRWVVALRSTYCTTTDRDLSPEIIACKQSLSHKDSVLPSSYDLGKNGQTPQSYFFEIHVHWSHKAPTHSTQAMDIQHALQAHRPQSVNVKSVQFTVHLCMLSAIACFPIAPPWMYRAMPCHKQSPTWICRQKDVTLGSSKEDLKLHADHLLWEAGSWLLHHENLAIYSGWIPHFWIVNNQHAEWTSHT